MTHDIIILLLSFVVIIVGAELFTNGVEWLGVRFRLSEGAVGSVLAEKRSPSGKGCKI